MKTIQKDTKYEQLVEGYEIKIGGTRGDHRADQTGQWLITVTNNSTNSQAGWNTELLVSVYNCVEGEYELLFFFNIFSLMLRAIQMNNSNKQLTI